MEISIPTAWNGKSGIPRRSPIRSGKLPVGPLVPFAFQPVGGDILAKWKLPQVLASVFDGNRQLQVRASSRLFGGGARGIIYRTAAGNRAYPGVGLGLSSVSIVSSLSASPSAQFMFVFLHFLLILGHFSNPDGWCITAKCNTNP